jgi:hypothetical protein
MGKAAGNFFGGQNGLSSAPADVDGDGLTDLLLGGRNNGDGNGGAVYLLLGDTLSTQSAAVRQRQSLSGSGDARPVRFEQAGVRVDYTAGALASGDVSVTRHLFHPCSTDKQLQTPIWTIGSSKFTAGATVELRFKYTDAAVEGMNEANLKVWMRPAGRPCGAWTMVASSVDAGHNFVSATGLTGLGQFTISEGEPSPTAVQERSLAVRLAQEPVELVIILALLVLSAGATYWRLRQHGLLPAAGAEAEMAAQLRQLAANQEEALAHLRRLAAAPAGDSKTAGTDPL